MRASPDRAQTVSSLLCLNCITLMLSEIQISFTRQCQAAQCQQLCQIDYKTHSASVTPQHRWSWVAPVSIQLLTGLYGGVCEAQQCHSAGVSISLKTYQYVQVGWSLAATGDLLHIVHCTLVCRDRIGHPGYTQLSSSRYGESSLDLQVLNRLYIQTSNKGAGRFRDEVGIPNSG